MMKCIRRGLRKEKWITDNIKISSVKRGDYENIIKFLSKFENETRNAKFWKTD